MKVEHPGRWPVGWSRDECDPEWTVHGVYYKEVWATADYILQLERERDEARAACCGWHERYSLCAKDRDRLREGERLADAEISRLRERIDELEEWNAERIAMNEGRHE